MVIELKTYIEEMKDRNYMSEIEAERSKALPNAQKVQELAADRNKKIDTLKMPYRKTNMLGYTDGPKYTPQKTSSGSVPQISAAAAGNRNTAAAAGSIGGYPIDTDFQALKLESEARGDYAAAAMYERLRNQKIEMLGLPYKKENIYNYDAPYADEVEKLRQQMLNREDFNYNYRTDDNYIAMKELKEEEAEKAFNDGYAQLTSQFDGGVPVNMMNKLWNTKSDIINQADSYIPQLQQLAYQMYNAEGDRMLQNYGLAQDMANQDYQRWASNRDFHISGLENAYNRATAKQQYDDSKNMWREEFDWNKDTRSKEFDWNKEQAQKQFDFTKETTERSFDADERAELASTATSLYNSGRAGTPEQALEMAKKLWQIGALMKE